MNIINLTPHDINIVRNDGTNVKTLRSTGIVARVEQKFDLEGDINSIPLKRAFWGKVIDLPEKKESTLYVCSALVANAAKVEERTDVVCPGEFLRDEKGNIIGAQCLMFP